MLFEKAPDSNAYFSFSVGREGCVNVPASLHVAEPAAGTGGGGRFSVWRSGEVVLEEAFKVRAWV